MRYLILLALAGCSHTEPGIEVRTVEVIKEVQVPCAAKPVERPEPVGTLPPGAADAVIVLAAKLLEWAGKGGYADRADTAIESCGT